MLINCSSHSIQLNNNLLNVRSSEGLSVRRGSTKLPRQWSTAELLWFNTNRKGLPPFSLLQYFMGTLISQLPGFRFRRHICDSICNSVCVDLKSLSVNDSRCGAVMSHVCLCLYSRLMQLCKPMQVSSCRLSWLLGRINPKNDFYKKSNRFGQNRYIYKNAYLLNENLFFREKYTCTLFFLGFFFHVCPKQ